MARTAITVRILVLALLFSGPALAQSPRFDIAQLHEMCAREDCISGILARIDQLQRLDLPGPDFNSQLGIIAAALFEVAGTANSVTAEILAEALRLLARYSSDATQRESFIWVAGQISNGAAELFDLDAPFAVSPA